MNKRLTKRSLLWGVLLAGVAGTLTGTTRAVRAESMTSSAVVAATQDDSGSATVKPYFWTNTAAEMAKQAEERQAIYSMPCGYGVRGVELPAFDALASRALD